MAQGPARRVRTLHLKGPSADAVRHGVTLVEDGLRVASMPGGEDSRMICVRSLDLGRFSASASSARVATAFERALSRVGATVVHGTDPSAGAAPAVFFNDVVEPVLLLARSLARGVRPTAWFWRLAVPAWRPEASLPEALRALVLELSASAPAPAAILAMVQMLCAEGAGPALVSGLSAGDGARLVQAMTGTAAPAAPPRARPGAPGAGAVAQEPLVEQLARVVPTWPRRDPRALVLALVAVAGGDPARLSEPGVVDQAQARLDAIHADRSAPEGRREPSPAPEPWPAGGAPAVKEPEVGHALAEQPAGAASEPPVGAGPTGGVEEAGAASGVGEDLRPSRHHRGPQERLVPAPSPLAELGETYERAPATLATGFAGLYLTVPLLARLGWWEWLSGGDAAAKAGAGPALLRRVATGFGADPEDPALAPLVIPRATEVGAEVLDPWIAAASGWCIEYAQLDLEALVCRRGRIRTSRTHVDVHFDLADADVRIRKAGLDLNPGWVPWLGRVVSYWYDGGEP